MRQHKDITLCVLVPTVFTYGRGTAETATGQLQCAQNHSSERIGMCTQNGCYTRHIVWPEILARYFGGLMKICHLAEFTLAVEPVLAIMTFIAKWLIELAGNLTEP